MLICNSEQKSTVVPEWVEMINDLVYGLGYSYSRIAYRAGLSPSTIQKLATNLKRKPRARVMHNLLQIYYKVFYGPYRTPTAVNYLKNKKNHSLAWIADLTME